MKYNILREITRKIPHKEIKFYLEAYLQSKNKALILLDE